MCSISCIHPMKTNRTCSLIANVWNKLHQLSSTYDNGQSMVIHPQVWNMLYQLSSTYDNWQRMVINPLGMKHAPWVVIISWQRSEHGDTPPRYERHEACTVSCHIFMATDRAWWYPSGMKYARSVVIISWQRSEHGDTSQVWNMLRQLSPSHDNGKNMVIPPQVWNMLYQLSSSHGNEQSIVLTP